MNGKNKKIKCSIKMHVKYPSIAFRFALFILPMFILISCGSLRNSTENHVAKSASDEAQEMIDNYKAKTDARLNILDEKISGILAWIEKEDEEEFSKRGSVKTSGLPGNPFEFNVWYEKGEKAFKKKEYDDAIKYFKEALVKATNDAAKAYTLNYRGTAYLRLQMYLEALKDYNNAIKYEILGHELPYYNKGIVLSLYPDKYNEAIESIKKSIEINPNFVDAYILLSNIYYEHGDNENASRMFQLFKKKSNESAIDSLEKLMMQRKKSKKEKLKNEN